MGNELKIILAILGRLEKNQRRMIKHLEIKTNEEKTEEIEKSPLDLYPTSKEIIEREKIRNQRKGERNF